MTYNNELQTNNTTLQSILATAQTLPDKSNVGTTVQKWTFTLEDGSTVDKYVEFPKVYTITYQLSSKVAITNTASSIEHGDTYSTTLSTFDSKGGFAYYDQIFVWFDDDSLLEFSPNQETPWFCEVVVPNVTQGFQLCVSVTSEGFEEW
jgi:hypothetical protein